jgi:hypothetical protein
MIDCCSWSPSVKPSWLMNRRVPAPSLTSRQVTVVSSGRDRQLKRTSRGGSRSSSWQWITPSNPVFGTGSVRKVNWCPTTGLKSLGISQRASKPGSVSACQTRCGGWRRNCSTSIAAISVLLHPG